jgi:hypothetical protein
MLDILVGLGTSDSGSPLHQVPHVDREDERVVFKPFALFGNQPHIILLYRSTPDQTEKSSDYWEPGTIHFFTDRLYRSTLDQPKSWFGLLGTRNNTPRAMINSKGRLAVPQCYSQ